MRVVIVVLQFQSGGHSGMEDDPGMTSPSNLSSRGAGSQMSPSNSETSESRCKYIDHFYLDLLPQHDVISSFSDMCECHYMRQLAFRTAGISPDENWQWLDHRSYS